MKDIDPSSVFFFLLLFWSKQILSNNWSIFFVSKQHGIILLIISFIIGRLLILVGRLSSYISNCFPNYLASFLHLFYMCPISPIAAPQCWRSSWGWLWWPYFNSSMNKRWRNCITSHVSLILQYLVALQKMVKSGHRYVTQLHISNNSMVVCFFDRPQRVEPQGILDLLL